MQSINAKTGQGSWNAAHFNDSTYDKLSREFVATPDLATQRRLAGQIERLVLEETPIIYAYFYDGLTATQKNVTGVYPARPQACLCGTQPELDGSVRTSE